jgi:hypothetical protein
VELEMDNTMNNNLKLIIMVQLLKLGNLLHQNMSLLLQVVILSRMTLLKCLLKNVNGNNIDNSKNRNSNNHKGGT